MSGPVWSPQGDLLAYVVYEREVDIETRDLITRKVLYSVGADGTGLTRIAEGETLDSLSWSPDGQWIAFTLREAWDRPFALCMAHPDGSGAFKVANVSLAPGAQLQWSPDGSKLLLVEGPGSLLIIDPYSRQKDGSKLRLNAKYASWSPDGSKIAVVVGAGKNAMIVDASECSHEDRELLIIVDSSLMNTQPLVMVDKDRNIKAARGE